MRVLVALCCALLFSTQVALAASSANFSGKIVGYRLSGIEPDGDPLDQVIMKTRLAATSTTPAVNLVINCYLENFQPDTTPILPDLLHPKRTAQNLGGFLEGKVLLTDDAGHVLAVGPFLAEAFLDNSNHAVMQLTPSSSRQGVSGTIRGTFTPRRDTSITGSMQANLVLPPPVRREIAQNAGKPMQSVEKIIGVVSVHPAPMMGKSTTGNPSAPLHTAFSQPASRSSSTTRPLSPLTVVAGAGAVLSFLLAGVLYWMQRRSSQTANESAN